MPGIAITGGGIAAAGSVVAASSIRVSNRRKVLESCRDDIETFHSGTASVRDMQNYATCVELLYPRREPFLAPWELLGLQIAFVMVVIGMVVGGVKGDNLFEGRIERGMMGATMGLVTTAATVLVIVTFVKGFVHLFL